MLDQKLDLTENIHRLLTYNKDYESSEWLEEFRILSAKYFLQYTYEDLPINVFSDLVGYLARKHYDIFRERNQIIVFNKFKIIKNRWHIKADNYSIITAYNLDSGNKITLPPEEFRHINKTHLLIVDMILNVVEINLPKKITNLNLEV